MRWEDERYVRIYTRDTADWLALGWEAQSLFVLALRKVDRAGILELGRAGPRGLAAVVGMPREVVERALPVLLDDGYVALNGSTLLVPNFIEAQEAPQSDAHRKRESRARARDAAAASGHVASRNVTETGRNVTADPESVTSGHVASQVVTPSCAVPSRAVPFVPLPARAREADAPPLPTREELLDSQHPATAALLAALADQGVPMNHARDRADRDAIEQLVAALEPSVALEAVLESYRVTPKGWIGWHRDALALAARAAAPPAASPLWTRLLAAHDALPPSEQWSGLYELRPREVDGELVLLTSDANRAEALTSLGWPERLSKLAGGVPVRLESGDAR